MMKSLITIHVNIDLKSPALLAIAANAKKKFRKS